MGAIPLDSLDLRDLTLRRIASMYTNKGDHFTPGFGGMSFSRAFLKERQLYERLINPLQEAGRVRVVDRPTKGSPGAGNAVVYLTEDASVQGSLKDISPVILKHATNFFLGNVANVNGIHIFPNTSPNAFKGVSVDVKRDNLTGQTLSKLRWPMGRGTRLIALPSYFDAETFIETEEALGAYARLIGANTDGSVKSIKFYYDEETYRVYLALAAGPTDNQKRLIRLQLQNAPKQTDVEQVKQMAEKIGRRARDLITATLMDFFPWKEDVEVVLDEPYVDMDTRSNGVVTAYSGGIKGEENGIGAYTVGLSDMIIYDADGKIVPLGTKLVPKGSPNFASGQNVKSKPFQSIVGMIPAEKTDIIDQLERPRPLKALALAYHDGMTVSNESEVVDPSL